MLNMKKYCVSRHLSAHLLFGVINSLYRSVFASMCCQLLSEQLSENVCESGDQFLFQDTQISQRDHTHTHKHTQQQTERVCGGCSYQSLSGGLVNSGYRQRRTGLYVI